MRNYRTLPLLVALTACVYVLAAEYGLTWLAERGWHQSTICWLVGAGRLIELPGMVIANHLHFNVEHHPAPFTWCVIFGVDIPLYVAVAFFLQRIPWRIIRFDIGRFPIAASPRPEAVRQSTDSSTRSELPTRRQFLAAGNYLALGGVAALAGYSFFIEPRRFLIRRHSIPITGLPRSLDGLTIAQLTDIHHGPWLPLDYVREVVDATNQLKPDLIALTGDYVLSSWRFIKPAVSELSRLRARIGIVGVMGNHDWWESAPETMSQFSNARIPLIDNNRLFVNDTGSLVDDLNNHPGLCVAGIGDYWEGSPNVFKALGDVRPDLPRLLLSHNPDAAESRSIRHGAYRIDLMLSGHTHGGQVWIPGFGTPVVPSAFGQKYAAGLVQGPACRVFISCGLGTTIMPIRFGQPPEIVMLTLRAV